jgi:cell division protein FtsW
MRKQCQLGHREVILCGIGVVLSLIGMVVLSSATHSFLKGSFLLKQLVMFGLAIAGLIFAMRVDLAAIRPRIPLLIGIALVFLLIVLIPGIGIKVNGSSRWLGFKQIRFQVSELAKVAFILAMAHYVAENQRLMSAFKEGFLMPCCLIGSFCALVILEPDLGTTVLFGLVGFSMLFLGGTRLRFLIPSTVLGFVLFLAGSFLNPLRWKRITAIFDVESQKLTSAYQLWQGILGFRSGGLLGLGLGNGRQQEAFLPEAHTDFIFSILGEEFGLFATIFVIVMFAIFFLIGVDILRRLRNLYYFEVAAGALLFVTFQALINMGVVTGLLPTKGMSLPFISYGGSNLILMFFLIGILINCSINGVLDEDAAIITKI